MKKSVITNDDLPGRISMFQKRHIEAAKNLIAKVLPDDIEEAKKCFEEYPFAPTREVPLTYRFVYEFGDWMAGVCGIYRVEEFPTDVCGLCWFGVDPYFQRHGIGTKLLEFAEALAKRNFCKMMVVWADESACSFYHKSGYQTRPNHIGPTEQGIFIFKHLQ